MMPALCQAVTALRAQGMLVTDPIQPPRVTRQKTTRAQRRRLTVAYTRPCLICGWFGLCAHREPEVELALLGVGHRVDALAGGRD